MAISRNIESLLRQSGDPGAILNAGQRQTQAVGQAVPSGKFGLALMGLLKQYQQLGTRPFVEQELGAREAQARRILQPAPQELIGAAPSIQAGARGAAAEALQPTIRGAEESQRTFSEQIRGLGSSLDQARAIGEWMEQSELKKKELEQREKESTKKEKFDLLMKFPGAIKNMSFKQREQFGKDIGLDPKLLEGLQEEDKLSVSESQALGVPFGTTKAEAMKRGIVPTPAGEKIDITGLTSDQRAYLNQLRTQARQDADIKIFPDVRASFEQGRAAYQKGKTGAAPGVGDIVLMRTIAKITDPASSVREEEFETFKGAQSTMARFGIRLTKEMWRGDKLSDTGRNQLFGMLQDIYNQRKSAYDNSYSFWNKQAIDAGIKQPVIPRYEAPQVETKGETKIIKIGEKKQIYKKAPGGWQLVK